MLKIVVADDEAFVLQSICTSINWKEIGLKLVGSCKDGMEAWHAILDENPGFSYDRYSYARIVWFRVD